MIVVSESAAVSRLRRKAAAEGNRLIKSPNDLSYGPMYTVDGRGIMREWGIFPDDAIRDGERLG